MAETVEQTGLPVTPPETKQASEEVAEFDPKKTYKFRGKTTKGKDLENMIFRGEGYSKMQSELDQLKQQLALADSDRQLLMSELSKIDKEKETRSYVENALSSMQKPVTKRGFNDEFDDSTDDDTPQMDSNKMLEMIAAMQNSIKQDVTAEVTQTSQSEIKNFLKQLLQEQETTKRTEQYIDSLDTMVEHQLETMYPNFASAEESKELFDKIVNVKKRMRGNQVEIGRLWEKQDPTWLEKNNDNIELEAELADIMGDIKNSESRYKELAEARQVIGIGAKPFRETINEVRPTKESDVKKWLADREKAGKRAWDAEMKAMKV